MLPTIGDLKTSFWSIVRGTALGSILGILPGGGALLASFAAYMFEKKVAKPPRNFGEGDIRGVAAPESANNAGAQTSFIPMLTLGIPSNPTMALMIGALMIQGIAPGPQVMTERPALFWGLIASMWVGNLMLLVLNLPLVGLWVRLLKVPYRLLFPSIFTFCCIGVYTVDSKIFDVYELAALTGVGYLLITGKLRRMRTGSISKSDLFEQRLDALRVLSGFDAACFEGKADIAVDGAPRQQGAFVVGEDHGDARRGSAHRHPIDHHPPVPRVQQTCDQP